MSTRSARPAQPAVEDEELPVLGGFRAEADDERAPRRAWAVGAAVGAACLVGLVVACAVGWPRAAERSVSARALLESPELAEIVTQNMMSIGKGSISPGDRPAVSEHVVRRLQNVSGTIRQFDPATHRQLEEVLLTEGQKRNVLRVLRFYGDERMLSFTHGLTDAVRETLLERGGHDSLKRRLSEKLAPRLGEMRELVEEMYPGHGKHFNLDLDELPVVQHFAKWHPDAAVDLDAGRSVQAARRLREDEDLDGGVQAQAHTFFQSLELELGDKMPQAPARMLQTAGSFFDPQGTQSGTQPSFGGSSGASSSGSDKDSQGFISCIMAAVPNPISVASCIAKNMQTVFKMLMNFVKGTPSTSR